MAETVGIVIVTERRGQDAVDSEIRVRSLQDLYETCRDAPPSRVVRLCLRGDDGDVWLNFASFLHKP